MDSINVRKKTLKVESDAPLFIPQNYVSELDMDGNSHLKVQEPVPLMLASDCSIETNVLLGVTRVSAQRISEDPTDVEAKLTNLISE